MRPFCKHILQYDYQPTNNRTHDLQQFILYFEMTSFDIILWTETFICRTNPSVFVLIATPYTTQCFNYTVKKCLYLKCASFQMEDCALY